MFADLLAGSGRDLFFSAVSAYAEEATRERGEPNGWVVALDNGEVHRVGGFEQAWWIIDRSADFGVEVTQLDPFYDGV